MSKRICVPCYTNCKGCGDGHVMYFINTDILFFEYQPCYLTEYPVDWEKVYKYLFKLVRTRRVSVLTVRQFLE